MGIVGCTIITVPYWVELFVEPPKRGYHGTVSSVPTANSGVAHQFPASSILGRENWPRSRKSSRKGSCGAAPLPPSLRAMQAACLRLRTEQKGSLKLRCGWTLAKTPPPTLVQVMTWTITVFIKNLLLSSWKWENKSNQVSFVNQRLAKFTSCWCIQWLVRTANWGFPRICTWISCGRGEPRINPMWVVSALLAESQLLSLVSIRGIDCWLERVSN